MIPAQEGKLSTTALAKKLNIPVQQLFTVLRDYGWIQRKGDAWALTQKGEFEGGSFHTSRRYGAYIVWPENVEQHPLLQAIESNQRITAAAMARYYPPLHARHINRALGELGLQHYSSLGWEPTRFGRSLGGLQEESEGGGAYQVSWPHEIVDNPVVHRELSLQSGQMALTGVAIPGEPDLFTGPTGVGISCRGVDGHELKTPLQARVCNWLYLARLAHAFQRALPVESPVYADFYLPDGGVYIDCWEADVPAGELSGKFGRRELYRELQLRHLEINASDSDKLDEVLGRGLSAFGVRC